MPDPDPVGGELGVKMFEAFQVHSPGTDIVTDALGCWSALDGIAASHSAIRTSSGRPHGSPSSAFEI